MLLDKGLFSLTCRKMDSHTPAVHLFSDDETLMQASWKTPARTHIAFETTNEHVCLLETTHILIFRDSRIQRQARSNTHTHTHTLTHSLTPYAPNVSAVMLK